MPIPVDPARVVALFQHHKGKPLKAKDVGKALGLPADDRGIVRDALKELARRGALVPLDGKRYVLPGDIDAHPGTVQRKASGVGWFIPDDRKLGDGFLPPGELASLVDGDRVLAELLRGPKGLVARVSRVLERRKTPLVGVLTVRGASAFVEVEGGVISGPILVENPQKVHSGDVVEVNLTAWPSNTTVAQGLVVRTLGRRGALDVEVEKILVEKGVWRPFPAVVIEDAARFGANPSEEDMVGREDLRALHLVTIDGETAKDFDDAVFARKAGRTSKDIEVTVAIADVSHYVEEGYPLDDEARKRGTSVYWPGSVVPMLPEALSNGLCSLKPHVDRLCLCARMTVSPDGAVSNEWFFTGVMRSHMRLTYTIVQHFLDGEPDALKEIPHTLHESLKLCEEASKRLRAARAQRGALDFDLPELKIELDANGAPTHIRPMERLYAHKLIEDLMVAANEAVARHFEEKDWPSVYRIHEPPDAEKLERFKKLARVTAGRKLDELDKGDSPRALMKLMGALKDSTKKRALDTLLLRSMMQAKYSTQNVGHYGLGSDAYLHFTSPIRRYPDLVVHRLLKQRLAGKAGARGKGKGKGASKGAGKHGDESLVRELDDIATLSSERERAATDVERAVDSLMGAYLMKDKVGESFDGVVQGVAEFGLFILLEPDTVEALLHVAEMGGDFWKFDDVHLALVGERTGKRYTVGDRVRVTVANVDLGRRQISLRFEGQTAEARPGARGPKADTRSDRPGRSESKRDGPPMRGRPSAGGDDAAERRRAFDERRRAFESTRGKSPGDARDAPMSRADRSRDTPRGGGDAGRPLRDWERGGKKKAGHKKKGPRSEKRGPRR